MPKTKNLEYYKILALKTTATFIELKQKYQKLVLSYYPDKNINKTLSEYIEAEQKFKEIQEAYEYLIVNHKEPKSRKQKTTLKKNMKRHQFQRKNMHQNQRKKQLIKLLKN
ncbi:23397_t:CDS:1 [Racocetra persica]|uniref:23397_t:CDS:1 n=1 Tax=Racocetra persica TaxID=160502 RepID=A0ACA9LN83_9GLOM|nr:23397_t:CDS:1 [Racocetra persica]